MSLSDGPWNASTPNELGSVITNGQGRVIAMGVPNPDDAVFICQARAEHHRDVTVQVDWKAFGRAVAAERKARRFSQDIAAEMCGISRNYMSQIERGQAADPSYTIVLTLCRWLRLEMPQ